MEVDARVGRLEAAVGQVLKRVENPPPVQATEMDTETPLIAELEAEEQRRVAAHVLVALVVETDTMIEKGP